MSKSSFLTSAFVATLSLGVALVAVELFLGFFFPQEMMFPRYTHSPAYGHELPAGQTMVAQRSGHWRFEYTINDDGYRGPRLRPEAVADKHRIVVLGDSYSMGAGVNDEETFSRAMQRELGDDFAVVNLGVGGYGLTQQIRRYHEQGAAFDPEFVVLQYSSNDLTDNLYSPVTTVEGGGFRFHDAAHSGGGLKALLQDSVLQHSHAYNLFRDQVYRLFRRHDTGEQTSPDRAVAYHLELLDLFASTLQAQGRQLLFIAVNGHLREAPALRSTVREMHEDGRLTYLEVEDWLAGLSDYGSPEGHIWGAPAHAVIGRELADEIVARQTN